MVTESQYFPGPAATRRNGIPGPAPAAWRFNSLGRSRAGGAFGIAKAVPLIYCFARRTDVPTVWGIRMSIKPILRVAAAALGMAWCLGTAWADQTGTANVIDGETLEMQGQVVKLFGIDALEVDQICLNGNRPWPCGDESVRSLAALIGGQPVRCQTIRNVGGNILATCDLNGEDLAAWMVSSGWAFADRSANSEYAPNEEAAQVAREGVWSGEYVTPSEWREGKRIKLPETPQTEEQDDGLPDYGPLNMAP